MWVWAVILITNGIWTLVQSNAGLVGFTREPTGNELLFFAVCMVGAIAFMMELENLYRQRQGPPAQT